MQTQEYPRLPEHVTSQILRHLTLVELLVIIERFGVRQICQRLGVDLARAIEEAAARGSKQ